MCIWLYNLGFYGNEVKKFCDMTDMLVSNSVFILHCWTAMGYSTLIPSKVVALMMTSMSLASQSDVEDIKLEYWSKKFSSSSLCTDSAVSISFAVTFCDLGGSDRVVDFFWKVYFLPNLLRKYLVVLTLNEISSPGLTCCDSWKDRVPVGNWLLLWVFSWNLWEFLVFL